MDVGKNKPKRDAAPLLYMTATFELITDSRGEYRWRLRHENGNILADSGEGYTSKQNAMNGIESVKENAAGAAVKDKT